MRWVLALPVVLMGCGFGGGDDDGANTVSRAGSVCGNPMIKGEAIGSIDGPGGCGVADAVRVTSVGGLSLSQSASINCQTAEALNTWVTRDVIPTVGKTGGGVTGLKVAAHYACRTRNHKAGARLSEHAKGNAIDISAFQLANGDEITVLGDWGGGKKGRILKDLHSAACGPFGTVLGPKSDRYHQDHFHMDVARYSGGPYCK